MTERWLTPGLAAALLLAAAPALAQDATTMRVVVNHAAAITLQAPATVALIANPDIADIVNEKNNLLFVLGRKPGATNLLVYDKDGKQLLSREIVVAPEDARMVTITRDTDPTTYLCEPRCRFYEHEQGGTVPATVSAGSGAGVGGANPAGAGATAAQAAAAAAGALGSQSGAANQTAPATAGHPGYP